VPVFTAPHDKEGDTRPRGGLHTPPGLTAWAAAWYADCTHRVGVVTHGRRVVLVYNLIGGTATGCGEASAGIAAAQLVRVLGGGADVHSAAVAAAAATPASPTTAATIRACLRRWAAHREGGRLLAIPLAHQYTPSSFTGVDALKPADRALLDAVLGCEVPLEVLLVRLSKTCHADVVCRHKPPCVWPTPAVDESTDSDAEWGHSVQDDPPDGRPPYGDALHATGRSHADAVTKWTPCPVVIDASVALDGGRGDLDGVPLAPWDIVPVGGRPRATRTAADDGASSSAAAIVGLPGMTAAAEVFGGDPVGEAYAPDYGNDGVNAAFVFHRAALVVWPAADGAAVTARVGASAAAGWVERRARRLPAAAAAADLDALLAAGVTTDAAGVEAEALPPCPVRRRSPLARLAAVAAATRATAFVVGLAAAAGRGGDRVPCAAWDAPRPPLLAAGLTCTDDGRAVIAAADAVGWPPAVATAVANAVTALTATADDLHGDAVAAAAAFVGGAAARGRDGGGGGGAGAFADALLRSRVAGWATDATAFAFVAAHGSGTRSASALAEALRDASAHRGYPCHGWHGTTLASVLAAAIVSAGRAPPPRRPLAELRPLLRHASHALVAEACEWRVAPRRVRRRRDRATVRVGVALLAAGAPTLAREWGEATAGVGGGSALAALLASPTVWRCAEAAATRVPGSGAPAVAARAAAPGAPAAAWRADVGGRAAPHSPPAAAYDATRHTLTALLRVRLAQTDRPRPACGWAMPAAPDHVAKGPTDGPRRAIFGGTRLSHDGYHRSDRLPALRAVTAFLRGPARSATFPVARAKDGRRLVRALRGGDPAAAVGRGWSVTAAVVVRDGDAVLTVVKTRDWWRAAVARWGEEQAERRALGVRLEGGDAAAAVVAPPPAADARP